MLKWSTSHICITRICTTQYAAKSSPRAPHTVQQMLFNALLRWLWTDTKVECSLPPALAQWTVLPGLLWHRGWPEKQHPTGCFSNIHYFLAKRGQPLTPINLRQKFKPPAGRGYLKTFRQKCFQVLLFRNLSWGRERNQQQTQTGSAWGAHWPQVWAPLGSLWTRDPRQLMLHHKTAELITEEKVTIQSAFLKSLKPPKPR